MALAEPPLNQQANLKNGVEQSQKQTQKKESKVVALLSLDRALLAQKRSPSLNST